MPQRDREKARRAWNKWYKHNRATHIARVRRCDKRRRKALREWLDGYKSTLKCERCPESHPATLDFHHRDGDEKDFSIGDVLRKGWSRARVEKEIAKCEVLCANCHRILHWKEKQAV